MKKFLIGLVVVATILQLNTIRTAQAASAPMLIRTANNPAVYFVSPRLQMKKLILNEEVFKSYGNTWSQVKIVDQKTLNKYPEIRAIKLIGKPQIYFINEGYKGYINTPALFNEIGLKWNEILEVNQTDLDSYIIGTDLLTARNKAYDTEIKAGVYRVKGGIEDYLTEHATLANYKTPNQDIPGCSEDAKYNTLINGNSYMIWADLCFVDDKDYCLDSTGNSTTTPRRVNENDTVCPIN